MIKCNRCGMMTTAGAVYCQSCGEALYDAAPKSVAQEQPELPAWLESLRAGERSAPPAQNVAGFSAADFIEEGSLPSWMRSERNEARDNTAGNPSVSARSAASPGSNPEAGSFSPSSINAQSLIDEQSLPSWMQGGGKSSSSSGGGPMSASSASGPVDQDNLPAWMKTLQQQPAPGKKPAAFESSPNAAAPTAQGFSARDLIDPQALPSWMGQQGSQPPPSFNPSASQAGASTQPPWMTGSQQAMPPSSSNVSGSIGTPGSGFSARDLIDPQALPSWMGQQGSQPPPPSFNPSASQAGASTQPPWMGQQGSQQAMPPSSSNVSGSIGTPGSGFSARDLIDPQALPSWMGQQGSQPPPPSFNPSAQAGAPPAPVRPVNPGNNFSASSLLDVEALPSWLRESAQEQKNISPASSDWSQPGQPWQMPPQSEPSWSVPGQQNPAQGGNVAASSFIDTNALPEWLRAANGDPRAAGGPSNQGMAAGPRQGGYAVPPRVDNMRVPSRPRSEMGQQGGSEEAANVFSSMLGVAPAAPNYPGSPNSQSYPPPGFMGNQQGPSGQPGMPNTPAGMNGQPAAGYPGGYPGQGSASGIYGGMAGNGQGQGYAGNGQGQGYAGNGQGQGYQMNTPPSGGNVARTPYGATGMADEQKNEAKTGKRGLFDFIRGWFER